MLCNPSNPCGRVFTREELEIIDPYGGPLQSYGLCYESLRRTILKLVNLLNGDENENAQTAAGDGAAV